MAEIAMNIEEQFHSKRVMSDIVGCNSINPKLLFIRHIFCDRLETQLQCARNNYFYSTMPEEERTFI